MVAYVEANISEYMQIILKECEISGIHDDESAILKILNHSSIDDSIKNMYIGLLKTKLSNINQLTNKAVWERCLKEKIVKYSVDNIFEYFKYAGLDSSLIDFINNATGTLDWSALDDKSTALLHHIIYCHSISDNKMVEIIKSSRYRDSKFKDKNYSPEKLSILIDIKALIMNKNNLNFIRNHYPSSTIPFIKKNLDEYIKIQTPDSFNLNECLELLNSSSYGSKKIAALLRFEKHPIPISKDKYNCNVNCYILENNLDTNDLPCIFSTYSTWQKPIQQIILNLSLTYIDKFISREYDLEDALKQDILTSATLAPEKRKRLSTL